MLKEGVSPKHRRLRLSPTSKKTRVTELMEERGGENSTDQEFQDPRMIKDLVNHHNELHSQRMIDRKDEETDQEYYDRKHTVHKKIEEKYANAVQAGQD